MSHQEQNSQKQGVNAVPTSPALKSHNYVITLNELFGDLIRAGYTIDGIKSEKDDAKSGYVRVRVDGSSTGNIHWELNKSVRTNSPALDKHLKKFYSKKKWHAVVRIWERKHELIIGVAITLICTAISVGIGVWATMRWA